MKFAILPALLFLNLTAHARDNELPFKCTLEHSPSITVQMPNPGLPTSLIVRNSGRIISNHYAQEQIFKVITKDRYFTGLVIKNGKMVIDDSLFLNGESGEVYYFSESLGINDNCI